jgi:Eco47II restriction endonuclease
MTDRYAPFISNVHFEECVKYLLQKSEEGKNESVKNFNRNVIDPFSAFFSMAAFNLSPDEWVKNEQLRQSGKSFANALGVFHQKLLGSIDGLDSISSDGQIDIVSKTLKIIAEVKNKHNTVNSSGASSIYSRLDNYVNNKNSKYKGFIAYYVVITPAKPTRFNEEFTPPNGDRGDKSPTKANVRKVDSQTFYELATGRKDALREIFEAFPKVVQALNSKSLILEYDYALSLFNKAFGQ